MSQQNLTRATFAGSHPDTLTTRNNLAFWLGESGRVAEAITAFEQLLADQSRVLGPDDPHTLTARYNLAGLLGESGRVAEAITAYEQLLADQSKVLGPDAPQTPCSPATTWWGCSAVRVGWPRR